MFQTLTRAHPAAINKSLWPWIRALYPIWAKHMTSEAFRLAVRLALTELLLSGCTTTSDHHYLYAAYLEDAMDVEAEEAARLGMRITLTRGSLNIKDQQGVISPANVVQDDDVILADSERVLRRYHDRLEGAMVQVALAPCAPFDVTLELMRETAALAERYDCLAPHPSGRDQDGSRILPQQICLHAGGISRPLQLAECPHLACPRHPFR